MATIPSLRAMRRAQRASSACVSIDPAELADWIAATEARIAAKVPIDERQLQRIINEQQTGLGETLDMRREAPSPEEAGRLGHQLEQGARVEPHAPPRPPLFDDAARARAIAMRRAGASYASIEHAFRRYRGVPTRRGLEQLVHRG